MLSSRGALGKGKPFSVTFGNVNKGKRFPIGQRILDVSEEDIIMKFGLRVERVKAARLRVEHLTRRSKSDELGS